MRLLYVGISPPTIHRMKVAGKNPELFHTAHVPIDMDTIDQTHQMGLEEKLHTVTKFRKRDLGQIVEKTGNNHRRFNKSDLYCICKVINDESPLAIQHEIEKLRSRLYEHVKDIKMTHIKEVQAGYDLLKELYVQH